MTSAELLSGVLPVLQTPLHEDESLDLPGLTREIDWVFETGADGVVVAMVSEVLRMGDQQRRELAARVCELVQSRGSVVISAGAESLSQAVSLARHAQQLGASAVMAIPPITSRLDSGGLYEYFAAIASSVSLPLIVQDASGYVGATIDLKVYLNLLDQFGPERIYFKPEASPLGPNLSRLRDASGGTARIFEGSGGINLVDCYRRGIVGTMPGSDLLDAVVALWQALRQGDEDRIYQLSLPLCALVALQLQAGLDGFLAIEKYLLHKRGVFSTMRRIHPVSWSLDAETQAEVDRLFERLMQALTGPASPK